jgi:hypothetical protein
MSEGVKSFSGLLPVVCGSLLKTQLHFVLIGPVSYAAYGNFSMNNLRLASPIIKAGDGVFLFALANSASIVYSNFMQS